MIKQPLPQVTFRAEPVDNANIATVANAVRATTGQPFVNKTEAIRAALKAAAAGKSVAEVFASR